MLNAGVIQQAVQLREAFLAVGGKAIFAIISMSDVPRQPFLVVTSSDSQKTATLEMFIKQMTNTSRGRTQVHRANDTALLIGEQDVLQRVRTTQPAKRPEIASAFSAGKSSPVKVLLVPSADQRRAIAETLPQLPPDWGDATGKEISDGVQWCVLALDLKPGFQAHLTIQSKDENTARRLRSIVVAATNSMAKTPLVQQRVPNIEQLMESFKPQVLADQIEFAMTPESGVLKAVLGAVLPAVTQARQSAKSMQAKNNLKQMALAMHVHHDAHKRFPAVANRDRDGKPLLSWRVHILPYIDQQELYKKFKLDEPWDSEHNSKLIAQIPPVYVDPNSKLKPGTTNFLAPVAEGTIWSIKDGARLRDIIDGSSQTIMVVRADPKKAVPWTKPDDLTIDPKTPARDLAAEGMEHFLAALCDGSVRTFSKSIDPAVLWNLFGYQDRKPIDWDTVD